MIGWLAFAVSASAADRVVLPPGTALADWQQALDLAGLVPTPAGSTGALVRVLAGPTEWTLRAQGQDGAIRVAKVAPPADAADREDVAFLARGLLASLAADVPSAPHDAPPPPFVPPPPPPPPPPAPAVRPPAPVVVEPEPVVAPEPTPEPVPPPVPEVVQAVEVAEAPLDPDEEEQEEQELAALIAEPPTQAIVFLRKTRVKAEVAPIHLASGVGFREGDQPAAVLVGGFELGRVNRTAFDLGLPIGFARDLNLDLFRRRWTFDPYLAVRIPVVGLTTVGPMGGVSMRSYRQQNSAIANETMPLLGLSASTAIPIRPWLALSFDLQAIADLGTTTYILDDGTPISHSPFETRFFVGNRFGLGTVAKESHR